MVVVAPAMGIKTIGRTMSRTHFDYFVIGAGSGGVRSARIAANHGAKVGIAEGRFYGGTCVNVGCVPKKLLTYAADFGADFVDALGYGWKAEKPGFDWPGFRRNKDAEITRLNRIYQNLLDHAGVQRFDSYAHFIDDHSLQVGEQVITADKILIATGGRPRRPDFPGAQHALVSDDMFALDSLPGHIVIQGGGYIGVEFAHIFHGLGVEVTLLHRGDLFLRGFDQDVRLFMRDELCKQGIHLHFDCDIQSIEQKDTLIVHTTKGQSITCDMVLSAIGRVPEIGKLCLGQAGIHFEKSGRIPVNEQFQTNVPHIYAIGDVTNRHNLTPVALAEGHALADRLFSQKTHDFNYENIPTAVFSRPPIGTIGLSEEEARTQGLDIELYKSSFKPLKHTLSGREERFFLKLIVNKTDDKVVGLHMAGEDAPEILQGFAVAIKMGATKADFDACLGIHPTAAEELVTLRTPSTT